MLNRREYTILIVEDDEKVAKVFSSMLKAPIYTHIHLDSLWSSSLSEAIDFCKDERFQIDAVVLDLNLPDSEGLSTLRELAKYNPPPILVVTGEDIPGLTYECFSAGASDYLKKPISSTDLLYRSCVHAIEHEEIEQQEREVTQELLKVEAKLSIVLDGISDGFFVLNDDLVVTYFNKAAEDFLGVSRGAVLGMPLFESFPEAKGSVFEEKYTKAIRERVPLVFETYFEIKPYRNWYAVRVYPFEDGISVYFQVITEQREVEAKMSELLDSARLLNAGVSHELRTPMQAILNSFEFVGVMANEPCPNRSGDKPCDLITNIHDTIVDGIIKTEHSVNILNSLSEYSKVARRGEVHLINLFPELTTLIKALSFTDRFKSIFPDGFILDLDKTECRVEMNRMDFELLISNLCRNAREAIEHDQPQIELRSEIVDSYAKICVVDNGEGVDPNLSEKIFEPYFSTKDDFQGKNQGLGLAMVRTIVEAHGGTIKYDSKPGRTEFIVTLPCVNKEQDMEV